MEIRYQLEPTDLEALNAFVHRGTPLGWVLRRPALVLVGGIALVAIMTFNRQNPDISAAPVLMFGGFMLFFWRRRHLNARKRGSVFFAPVALTMTQEGILTAATGRSSSTAWSEIRGYGETVDHIFVMLDGLAGHVIPKRGLSCEETKGLIEELGRYSKPLLPSPQPRSGRPLVLASLWLVLVLVVFLAWRFFGFRG